MGPILTPADTTKAQWDWIVSTLRTEMSGTGRLVSCAWTDAAGNAQTSTIADVRRSLHLFTEKTPAIGVQLARWSVATHASQRRMLSTEFTIIVATKSEEQQIGANILPANGDEAAAEGFAFISDGTGNGLSEIFRDPNNYTLGGNAMNSILSEGVPTLEIGDGATPQLWAYYYLTLRAQKLLAIS